MKAATEVTNIPTMGLSIVGGNKGEGREMNGTTRDTRIKYKLDGGYIVKEWRGIWVTIARDIPTAREARELCKR